MLYISSTSKREAVAVISVTICCLSKVVWEGIRMSRLGSYLFIRLSLNTKWWIPGLGLWFARKLETLGLRVFKISI